MISVDHLGQADYLLLSSMANEELALFDKPLKLGDYFQARLQRNVINSKVSLKQENPDCDFISFGLPLDKGFVIETVTDLTLAGSSVCDKLKVMIDVVHDELFVGRIALNELFSERKLVLSESESRRINQDKAAVARAVRMLNTLGVSVSKAAKRRLEDNKREMGNAKREGFALRNDLVGESGMSYLLMMLGINE